jgi:shikimate dehydrogenase
MGTPGDVAGADLVVQATPVGMGGVLGEGAVASIDTSAFRPDQLVVDLVYHPRRTAFLEAAAQRGAVVLNGLGMLVHQAALAVERWTGCAVPVEAMWAAAQAHLDGH